MTDDTTNTLATYTVAATPAAVLPSTTEVVVFDGSKPDVATLAADVRPSPYLKSFEEIEP